jgi:hypothetical protein
LNNLGLPKEEERVFLALSSVQNKFDVMKYIIFVPLFVEKEVDKYFVHFEKIAISMA